ncbi:hypothetical protein BD410DRAFT_844237 [Rickenella mellea]|uniref:Uncharacterized protein n=1 Tax=Rickenella mellea TaxID=50990 RepID=A0A4Y7PND8_9AGAM|nr:hypothetical protein BD410DRAFT_844237 [Rickenella mellea]
MFQASTDLSAFNALAKVLNSLQANGGDMSKDSVWMGTEDENVTKGGMDHPYSQSILRLLQPLRRLTRQKQLIEKLDAELNTRIQSLRKKCLPLMMEDGIKRMPNEILVNIFHIGHHSTEDYSFLIPMTHVSQRFRSLALQASTLWTRIKASRCQKPDKILTFIDRSRQQGLDVTLIEDCGTTHVGAACVYDIIHASSLRWTSLHAASSSAGGIPKDLPLSRVRRLSFVNDSDKKDVHNIPWTFPGLQIFEGTNTIPKFFRLTPLLTVCSLSFSKAFFPAKKFMAFLPQLICIEDFRLVFQYRDIVHHDFEAGARLTMTAMQVLSVTFNDEDGARLVRALLSRLVIPNLSRLVMCCEDANDAVIVLEPLRVNPYRYHPIFGTPRNIDVKILSRKGVNIAALLLTPLQAMRHLSVTIPNAKLITTPASHNGGNEDLREKLGSLQSIRFVNCHRLHEQQVQGLADTLLENRSGRGLQLLEIFSCNGISEGFLMELSRKLGVKISWRA